MDVLVNTIESASGLKGGCEFPARLPAQGTKHRTSLRQNMAQTLRNAAMIAIGFAVVACSGGPQDDKVTIGTGQGQSADPVTVDFPIFYVKRPVPDPMAPQSNVLRIRQFEIDADLYMRASASPSATEVNLTGTLTKHLGDVRDVDVSYDGKKVIFAMRFPFRANTREEDLPTWNIWEYDIPSGALRRVIADDNTAEAGNDRFPHYLPDGRILFSSTRQRTSQAILLDEGKPQYQSQDENNREPASLLHVMDATGNNIHQITFNQSHDLDAAVLSNGQIVFSRWDGATNTDVVSLYRMNPDGSALELLYGKQNATHATGTTTPVNGAAPLNNNVIQFLSPRPLQDGRILTLTRQFSGTEEGGDLIKIDTANYVENTQPTLPNVGVLNGPAQTRASPVAVYTTPGPSPGGRYRSAFPLADSSNRLLVSWSQCRLIDNGNVVPCTANNLDPNIQPPLLQAPPLYGIYIYDLNQNTQLPIVVPQESFIYSDVVAAAARTLPPVILDRVSGVDYASELETQVAGVIDIKSVYDVDGVDTAPGGIATLRNPRNATAAQRPARFVRIEKAVSLPNRQVRDIKGTSFGPTGRFMREILGYAPVEPDGSVRVKVPANVAIQLTVVDSNTRRISPLHRNWMQLRPGEILTCNGCHNPNATAPAIPKSHGRSNLFAAVNPGAPASGLFPNTDTALQGNPNETMAQARARAMCRMSQGAACGPSVDVIFDDYWTDPTTAGRAKDASTDYCYTAGPTDVGSDAADINIKHACASKIETLAPTPPTCESKWTSNCRIVINYVQNIQPLWEADRLAGAANNKCITCHTPINATGQARVPAGQLDLSNSADINQPDHLTSYEKLLFPHIDQELNATMTALQDVCLTLDPVTGVCITFATTSNSMNALNARGSRFFTAVNASSHAGFLTEAEQRLISEWLDIGAQYYNDPFLAPVN